MAEIELKTAPADFRFPTTNQTRHCFTRYIEFHRCVAAKGEESGDCGKFAKYYRSLCPGLVGSCCRVSCLLWVYLVVMFLLILLLFCFTIFAFVVTNKGAGEALSGRGYKEYRLGGYSDWLQKRVNNDKNWNKIRSCLQDSKICQRLLDDGSSTRVEDFYKEHLSSLQSGCCKPSNDCNFQYISPTNWTRTPTPSLTNPDCTDWSNDPSILCYHCQSCKAGLLDNIKRDWKRVAVINIIFLIFLIIVYSVGCCAFRNNREDNSWKRYP
ncbi:unnamed protein product [Fraxinus pennsylvanica]|uniref:Tetraspanin-8 n=1 Tax=Fraxinus pennsylvanica TaxID=56036 RepID=A0AAD2EE93_9LAMI|nr:unnamed protein product [Fraxinus pennsylvanica]